LSRRIQTDFLAANLFSDLTLLAETLHQIDLYQPWASKFEHNVVDDDEVIKADFAESLSTFAELIRDFKDTCGTRIPISRQVLLSY
jgi:hypothetical protein